MKKRIAVLFQDRLHTPDVQNYMITHLGTMWRQMGFEVYFFIGPGKYIPADLLILHVDLSVVDEKYFEFAARFPIVLNGTLKDIRKSQISTLLVTPGDGYDGPVVVKSSLNCGGLPENRYENWPAGIDQEKLNPYRGYRTFESIDTVPPEILTDPGFVVERFLPEYENGLYHIRYYSFLGDRWNCVRRSARTEIVTSSTVTADREVIEVAPAIAQLREEMGFDYGKFDYVEHGGEPFLIDANKTTGAGHPALLKDAGYQKALRNLAEGIHYYFR